MRKKEVMWWYSLSLSLTNTHSNILSQSLIFTKCIGKTQICKLTDRSTDVRCSLCLFLLSCLAVVLVEMTIIHKGTHPTTDSPCEVKSEHDHGRRMALRNVLIVHSRI